MYRNASSRFSMAPQADIKRSVFPIKYTHKTTFNAGDLVPIYVQEVLPGDTFNLDTTSLVRLATPIHPTMDNLFLDTYYFFVPNRLIWDNFTKFMGENDKQWAQDTSLFVPPYIKYGGSYDNVNNIIGSCEAGSLLNYLGIPVHANGSKDEFRATCLDLNAYIKIFNDWFRDENLMDEAPIWKNDGVVPITNYLDVLAVWKGLYNGNGNAIYASDSCFKVSRFHDYFSSALPAPQKGPDVLIPTSGGNVYLNNTDNNQFFVDVDGNPVPVSDGGDTVLAGKNGSLHYIETDGGDAWLNPNGSLKVSGIVITVNDLRLAIQTQKLLERDARGGTRYTEIIYSHFGVQSPDARLQRSEYLGGKRTLLNMDEVIQTSQTATTPLGTLAGRSVSVSQENGFTKSFTEHGYIIGVACVRTSKTYSQGLPRRYSRFDRLAYYWSVLANIGEQPIMNKELFISNANEGKNDEVFGYQEAWADYRYTPDRVSGLFSPDASGTLVSWTYADDYNLTPKLSPSWLIQGNTEVARTLAVVNQPQFIADFYFHGKAVRPMPVYSVPGLVDHH